MENLTKKRKRTANFTADEKLRFVRLLREEGQCIVSKVTSHDASTNKQKELTWTKITIMHNSAGDMTRTTEALKKLWSKLKMEAKTFKAAHKRSVTGTGGGPSKKFEDPVLELVAEVTGRASTGILNIDDCDADETIRDDWLATASPPIEYLDESLLKEEFPEDMIIEVKEVIEKNLEKDENTAQKVAVVTNKNKQILKKPQEAQETAINVTNNIKGKEWANRRRPDINVGNERMEKIKTQQRVSNRLAADRLRAEQEKIDLILQQKTQYAELHSKKMENERLKQELLKTLLKKVSDSDSKDVLKVATQFAFESSE